MALRGTTICALIPCEEWRMKMQKDYEETAMGVEPSTNRIRE